MSGSQSVEKCPDPLGGDFGLGCDYKITVCISGNTDCLHLSAPLGHNLLVVETCS